MKNSSEGLGLQYYPIYINWIYEEFKKKSFQISSFVEMKWGYINVLINNL